MNMVLVEWTDARGVGSDWRTVKDLNDGLCLVLSLGFKANETDEYVVVVPHLFDEDDASPSQGTGEMYIPKRAIKRLVFLKEE